MEYEQYTLEEQQKIFEKEPNSEELNKIMSAISDKHECCRKIMKKPIMSN